VLQFPVPLDLENPIGYQKVSGIKNYFLVTTTGSSHLELDNMELQACQKNSLYTCKHAFSRRTTGVTWTCTSAAFFNRTDLLLELCEIIIFPTTKITPMSLPDTNNSHIIINPTMKYDLLCDNIKRTYDCPVLFSIKVDCMCNLEYAGLLLYDTGRDCMPSAVIITHVDSNYFLINQAINDIPLSTARITDYYTGETRTSNKLLEIALDKMEDLTEQQKEGGLSLRRIATCIETDSRRYHVGSNLEFLWDVPMLRSSSYQLVFSIIIGITTLFTLIVSCWVLKHHKFWPVLCATLGRSRTVQSTVTEKTTSGIQFPSTVTVEFSTLTTGLQYLILIGFVIILITRLHKLSYAMRMQLPCKNCFITPGHGTPIFIRIAVAELKAVTFYVGVIPFDLSQGLITLLPVPVQRSAKLTYHYCTLSATLSIKWQNKLHYAYGIQQGQYQLPEKYRLNIVDAKRLEKIIVMQRITGETPIQLLIRNPYTEFQQLTVHPQLLISHLVHQSDVDRLELLRPTSPPTYQTDPSNMPDDPSIDLAFLAFRMNQIKMLQDHGVNSESVIPRSSIQSPEPSMSVPRCSSPKNPNPSAPVFGHGFQQEEAENWDLDHSIV